MMVGYNFCSSKPLTRQWCHALYFPLTSHSSYDVLLSTHQ
jgi:hypothetical protein